MQNSELFEKKRQESIKLKNQAKKFAEKLARKKAEEVFTERVQPTTMFTETKKKQFIDKITQQYEPIFYKDIINKIISQKVMEEQKQQLYNYSKKKSSKEKNVNFSQYPENVEKIDSKSNQENTEDNQDEDIAQAIINSSREVFNLLNKDTSTNLENENIPNNILQDNSNNDEEERLVMSILKK